MEIKTETHLENYIQRVFQVDNLVHTVNKEKSEILNYVHVIGIPSGRCFTTI